MIMKKISIFLVAAIFSMAAILSSFTTANDGLNTIPDPPNEFETLLTYFETNNNFINSDLQLIIPADEVKQNMKNPKYHIIDIRSDSWFEFGHIKNANNVIAEDLLSYFETKIAPADYEKIVMVCYSGQSAAYYSSLLRLAGYDNVYSMMWGMSSWREDFAENSWMKNAKNTFADKLESTENPKVEAGTHPALSTGSTEAKDILKARLEKAFATPYKEYILKSDDVFANPGDYYVVNYWDMDKYKFGHIPGAVQLSARIIIGVNNRSILHCQPIRK